MANVQRPVLSDVLTAYDNYRNEQFVDDLFETIIVGGTTTIGNIGTPVVWISGNSRWEVYVAQDLSAVTGSPAYNGAKVAVLVGDNAGLGDQEDTDLSAGDTPLTALTHGRADLLETGMIWGSADASAQTAFRAELLNQGIRFAEVADSATPTYLS